MPAITYGLKGLAYFEIIVQGANRDLHSGTYGGAVANPLNALATILASLKGPDGRIRIAGFYDAVRPLEDWERAEFAKLPFSEAEFQADLGVTALEGEAGYTTLERKWARPTCDVNGIYGGYAGPGPKTVLPCKAGAKLSFRLVPDQDPKTVDALFREHVAAVCPPGVTVRDHRPTTVRRRCWSTSTPPASAPPSGPSRPASAPSPSSSAKGARSRSSACSSSSWRRHAAPGLGPERRQPARPQREVLAGRLPPRHQGERPSAGGAGRRRTLRTPPVAIGRLTRRQGVPTSTPIRSQARTGAWIAPDVNHELVKDRHARPEIRHRQHRGGQAELPQPERPGRRARGHRPGRRARRRAQGAAPGRRGGPPPAERGRPGDRQGEGPRPAGRADRGGQAAQGRGRATRRSSSGVLDDEIQQRLGGSPT